MVETSTITRTSRFSLVASVVAIAALALGTFLLGARNGRTQPEISTTGVVFATMSMDCGGKTFNVSTALRQVFANRTLPLTVVPHQ